MVVKADGYCLYGGEHAHISNFIFGKPPRQQRIFQTVKSGAMEKR